MTNATIKGIIFDLYGVNVHRNEQLTRDAFAKRIGCSTETIGKAFDDSGREQLKLGTTTQRRFVSRLNKHLSANLTINEVRSLWNVTLTLDHSMITLLKTLKQHYKLFLLTNLNEFDWQAVRQLDLSNYFDDLFLSFELKMKKPNPQVFQTVVDLTGIDARDLLFIDDQMKNVSAASQLGMSSLQFKDSQTLHHQLHRLCLL